MMSRVSFGAASSPRGRPVFHVVLCFSARFARKRSRWIARTSLNGALAANSACRIAFGNSIAVRTPRDVQHIHNLVLIWREQPLAFSEGGRDHPLTLDPAPHIDEAILLGVVDKRLLVREFPLRHPPSAALLVVSLPE